MSYNQFNRVKTGKAAKDLILDGLELCYNAVKPTLGGNGSNVTIMPYVHNHYEQKYYVQNTKDGVTVIKSIYSSVPEMTIAIDLLKMTCNKTVEEVGDGTTTTVILEYHLYKRGLELLERNRSLNPHRLIRELEETLVKVLDYIDANSISINTEKELYNIAMISSNNDKQISSLLTPLIFEYGNNININIKENYGGETSVEKVDGILLGRGYLTDKLLDNPYDVVKEMDNCLVFMTDEFVNNYSQLYQLISYAKDTPLLIIAKGYNSDTVQYVIENNKSGATNVMLSTTTDYLAYERLEDISTYVGGKVISRINGSSIGYMNKDLKNMTYGINKFDIYLGKCDKVIVSLDKVIFQLNKDNKLKVLPKLNIKVDMLSKMIDAERSKEGVDNQYTIKMLEQRISNLSEAIVNLSIGGNSELEIKERTDRADDCVNSLKCALKGGYVVGGGKTFLNASKTLSETTSTFGGNLLLDVLKEPCRQIVRAADNPDHIIDMLIDGKLNEVYDIVNYDYVDGIENGIIDASLVLKSALINACSLASTLLLTECVIINQFIPNNV